MTAIASRNSFRRAFACWPSRIGALALIALALSAGSEAFAYPQPVAAVIETLAQVSG